MRPAMGEHEQPVVAARVPLGLVSAVAVDLQHPAEAVQDRGGMRGAAPGGIVVDHARRIGAAPAPVVAR